METPGRKPSRSLRVTRRLLIVSWLWGIASLFAIGGVLYHLFRERNAFLRNRSRIPEVQLIRERFGYLTIDSGGLRRFLKDYRRALGPPSLGNEREVQRFLDTFLMSTTFFAEGADESRTVRYVALYDVFTNPCYQPLPRHPIESSATDAYGTGRGGSSESACELAAGSSSSGCSSSSSSSL